MSPNGSIDPDLWVPGNLTWDQLDFGRNCTAWGQWLGAMIQPDPWDPKHARGMSVDLSGILFLNAVPEGTTLKSMGYHNLSDWFADVSWFFSYNMLHTPVPPPPELPNYWQFSPRFNNSIVWGPKPRCEADFCKAAGYTGSQDLCGIGVVVSYFLEALLGTIYLVVFTIHQMVKRHRKNSGYDKKRPNEGETIMGRLLDSFRGSLDMFLSGAMLIAVAMLGAALYSSITSVQERSETNPDMPSGEAMFEMALSLIASNFAVFPVMLLYALVKHDGHRKWLHRSVLFLLWGLSCSVVFLAPRGEVDYAQRKSGKMNFDCDQRGSQYWHVVKATQFLVIGMPLVWLIITIFLTTGFKIPGMVDKPWVRNWRAIWRLLTAWVNLLLMWGILAYFAHFRQKIIDAAGGLDKNDKWTFGQVLALAAWVPVVAELFYIMAFGLEDSLSGHVPPDYHVSQVVYMPQNDPNMGVPLLQTASAAPVSYPDQMHDLKHTAMDTSYSTSVAPVAPPSEQTAWHDPNYQPFQKMTRVQRHVSWDPYYHTGW
ncbi:C6 zinc finger domain containing protein [Colletotrichum musicola]|uniref:C6 zinc finger domain containing protein n=1 Tax=Colletotrichum musicola TaxID=2175873 RepID=A0A8H6JF08_9PEZI|nr:C6 zinc finger domain containing protein [Colletotrichum musicola]